MLYLPSADKIAAEKSSVTIDRVPSSAGLSDAYTDATTDDERNELWTTAKTFVFSKNHAKIHFFCKFEFWESTFEIRILSFDIR